MGWSTQNILEQTKPKYVPLFRVLGQITLALLALVVTAAGEHRFLLAGILLFLSVPTAIGLNIRFRTADTGWVEPLYDLFLIVTLVHLVPGVWHVVLCIGLMVALAPSVSLHPKSYLIYGGFAALLLGGLSFAAWLHDVDGWVLPITVVAALYPSVIYYAHWQVRRADELRARAHQLQGITQLAGSVAHDFNNVLTGVSGYAELALHDLPAGHPAAQSLNEVINGANRASLLCGQLLTFAGRNVKTLQTINLSEELEMIAGLLQPVVPKAVHIKVVDCPADIYVQGDRSQLQQVVMNVIINAGEATTQTPTTIELTLRQESDGQQQWALLEVTDYGSGIPRHALEEIFDPFFTTKERGHGLGLASALRIMEVHEGTIEVDSAIGKGTTVSLRIPSVAPPKPQAAIVRDASPQKRGQIMVVDDEAAVREVAAGLLQHLNYDVVQASDGFAAIDIYKAHQATCIAILLDLSMPGKDGWSCLADLRKINHDVPVIICSGYDPEGSAPDSQKGSHKDPNVSFLSKPFRKEDLERVLTAIVQLQPNPPGVL